jgi:integrase/recombinase XerD
MRTTAAIVLETRRTLADGTHPTKLRITHNRQRKYYTVHLAPEVTGLTADQWERVTGKNPRGKYAELQQVKNETESTAYAVISQIKEFSFDAFEQSYFKHANKVDLLAAMAMTAKELRNEGRIKTAIVYETATKSLSVFVKTDKLLFTKVTPQLLKKYEIEMQARGRSTTTISMYLRAVRATFNKYGITDPYPFGSGKYKMPTGRKIKKALTLFYIAKIYKYDAIEGTPRDKARDYWILSYLCNGTNIKDLAQLKYKNIDSEAITFVRAKTARKISRAVMVPLTTEIGKLIDKYGQRPATPETYVLPILADGMTPEQQRVAIDNTVRMINKHIKIIAENIGLTANVSTYTARHSFATVLKRSGASIEFISESLGHQDLKTTENYLADFEIDKKREMAAILTNWDNG